MPSSGPNYTGLGQDDNSNGGAKTWSNPTNAQADDGSYATADASFGQTAQLTHYLRANSFGFSIPAAATINGIVVEIEHKEGSVGSNVVDTEVKLVKGGTVQGNNKASAVEWATTDEVISYGGAADLWGLSLTPTDVNLSNFGVVLSATFDYGGVGVTEVSVDFVRMTVHYTLAVSVTGSQPAASGTVAQSAGSTFSRSIVGAQAAATGTVSRILQAVRAVTGSQPAASGTVAAVRIFARTVVGVQAAATGTVTRILQAVRTVAGTQPAATGIIYFVLVPWAGLRRMRAVITDTLGVIKGHIIP